MKQGPKGGYDYTYSYQDREYGRQTSGVTPPTFPTTITEVCLAPSQSIQAKISLSTALAESLLKPVQGVTAKLVLPSVIAESPQKPTQVIGAQIGIPIAMSETPAKPVEGITANIVSPLALAESDPPPVQVITGTETDPSAGFQITIAESMPPPSQSVSVQAPATQQGPGAWSYFPPNFPSKARIRENTLVPRQGIRAESRIPHIVIQSNTHYTVRTGTLHVARIAESSLAPIQEGVARARRSPRLREDEDKLLLMLLDQL